MAEGGGEFGYEDPDIDNQLDYDDDDGEQEVDRTRPFQPGASSTPYHRGEQMEMQTMQHEQSGLPETSYQETADTAPLLGKRNVTNEELEKRLARLKRDRVTGMLDMANIDTSENLLSADDQEIEIQKVRDFIKKRYEQADLKKLGVIKFSSNPKKPMDIVVVGPGQEQLSYQIQKENEEVEVIRSRIEQTQSKIDAISDEKGSNIENEAELRRLKQQKKNFQTELENKKKDLASITKRVKNMDKEKAIVDRLRASIAAKESETNAMEERLNQTKQLDDLKEQESELQRKNAEDQAIIQDENASPSDIQAAEDRVAERNEELARLQTQIAERERAPPLLERVKEIFKKYGVTVTSVLLAAGVTIGVVAGSITKALKATGQALGKGLKDIGAKLGSLLPGLIGSIVSFIFKAAGQAIGFLAEHTWLLILAVVAFLFEKYLKKRR